jgi:hypothetical protein
MTEYTELDIAKLALKYWNEDKIPPEDAMTLVAEYIRTHPDLFRGVIPM